MPSIDELRDSFPDAAKDVRLNLSSVLRGDNLDEKQTWAVALTSAYFLRNDELRDAVLADAADHLTDEDITDAQAAAAIMGMNTVYYRFRHMIGKESYSQRRAGLRMNVIMSPASSKKQFELCALACAALAGCEACLKAHEKTLLDAGLGEEHVHDAVRIAAVLNSAAVALSTR